MRNNVSRLEAAKFIQVDFLDEHGNRTCSQQTTDRYTQENFEEWHRRLSQLDLGSGGFELTAYVERFVQAEAWP